jgi:hypothetical protein
MILMPIKGSWAEALLLITLGGLRIALLEEVSLDCFKTVADGVEVCSSCLTA